MPQLLIISHVLHYPRGGRLWAYGPYAREIVRWAGLFDRVVVASPLGSGEVPADAAPLPGNVTLDPIDAGGGSCLHRKILQALSLPFLSVRLIRAIRRADVVHVRCPGNLGFLGSALTPLFHKPRIAKYAGQWPNFPGEAFSCRVGKRLFKSAWWGAPVLVYGQWPNQPSHIVPFFTSVMDDNQMRRASETHPRARQGALKVLFVGRLSKAKNVEVLLRAVAVLVQEQKQLKLTVVGDGPERHALETLATAQGIRPHVTFTGAVPQESVFDYYEQAHVVVLASETEGWPKALSEGMAFANVCIGSNRGLVPQMLAQGRGLLVEPGSLPSLARALRHTYDDPETASRMAQVAADWSRRFTLGEVARQLRRVLTDQMGIVLSPGNAELRSGTA